MDQIAGTARRHPVELPAEGRLLPLTMEGVAIGNVSCSGPMRAIASVRVTSELS
jgi:hypothetical protein